MRVLIIASGISGGGAENFAWSQALALRRAGHTVKILACANKEGQSDRHIDYPIEKTGLEDKELARSASLKTKLVLAGRIFWNAEIFRLVRYALDDFKPEIIQLHRVRNLSISLFWALRGYEKGVFMTLHDHYLTCPSSTRTFGDGSPCTLGRCRPITAVQRKCVRGSRSMTLVSVLEFYMRYWTTNDHKGVRSFLVPSKFLRNWTMRSGVSEARLKYMPNFSPCSEGIVADGPSEEGGAGYDRNTFSFVGRVSEEKGISVLMMALKGLPEVRFKIVGDGPLLGELRDFVRREKLDNVKILGRLSGENLNREIARSRALILPSTCFENAPLVIIEAYQLGVPVIGSDRGGISEMITDEMTGLLFEAGNSEALISKIRKMTMDESLRDRMVREVREVAKQFNEQSYVQRWIEYCTPEFDAEEKRIVKQL